MNVILMSQEIINTDPVEAIREQSYIDFNNLEPKILDFIKYEALLKENNLEKPKDNPI